ncbi:MAG: MerR family transcriptional regulator [Paracoccaceae bacterium]
MRLDERQVAEVVGVISVSELRVWVSEGWVRPASGGGGQKFDETDVARIRLVCELRESLGLEEDAVPLVLSLIDQLHGLRGELKALAGAIDDQPEDIRDRVRGAYEARMRPRG